MNDSLKISLHELVSALSTAVDLVSPRVANHHKKVAYIAASIAQEAGLSAKSVQNLVWAGQLHDIGAITLTERIKLAEFDVESTDLHCDVGAFYLSNFAPLRDIAEIILYHHRPWDNGTTASRLDEIPLESHILHVSDRIDVLIDPNLEILEQVAGIEKRIVSKLDVQFHPELVAAFRKLASREYFWLELRLPDLDSILKRFVTEDTLLLKTDDFHELAKLFSYIIDFKSVFTATHSAGVAEVAAELATICGLPESEIMQLRVAGLLHDIGKLSVPTEIIEKNGKLDEREFNQMRKHTFFTNYILGKVNGLEKIKQYAAYHHERLDGTGYPFHFDDKRLPLGTKIMSVADVFTAITEDRPYRKGMTDESARQVLQSMVSDRKLDGEIVDTLLVNFQRVDNSRRQAQSNARGLFQSFQLHRKAVLN